MVEEMDMRWVLPRPGVALGSIALVAVAFAFFAGSAFAITLEKAPGQGFDTSGVNSGTITGAPGTGTGTPPCTTCVPQNIPVTYDSSTQAISVTAPAGVSGVTTSGSGGATDGNPDPDTTVPGDGPGTIPHDLDGQTITCNGLTSKNVAVSTMNGVKYGYSTQAEKDNVTGQYSVVVGFDIPCPGDATKKCHYQVTITVKLDKDGNPESATATSP